VGSSAFNAAFVLRWTGSRWHEVHVRSPRGAAVLLLAVAVGARHSIWTAGLTINSDDYSEQAFSEYACP
jgi:hypothetical protein